jgi:pilus assembly protein CpaF
MQTRQPNLEGNGEVRLRRLVKESLRMRPDRIIVGEVRHEEALDLLLALNSGVPGLATVHANSARDAITKLCTLPLLAAENVTSAFVTPTVAATIDLVVFIKRDPVGRRRVTEVVAVPGRCDAGVIEIEPIFTEVAGQLQRSRGYPPHAERFAQHGFDLSALLGAQAEGVLR